MHDLSSRISIVSESAPQLSLCRATFACAPALHRLSSVLMLVALLSSIGGCGKTIKSTATEQLILSDSVDRAILSIDFSPLAGRACFLDTTHLKTNSRSTSLVNADYVISSLRNQLVSAGGTLAESRKEAEIIVEPRLGVLGSNEHEVTYGIPSSSILSQAAALVPTAPPIPTIPEIALARKYDQMAATKLAVFAYDAKTGAPVWQSGVETATSNARDTWVLGVGPFQSGNIYEERSFGSFQTQMPLIADKDHDENRQAISFDEEFVFIEPHDPTREPAPLPQGVMHASHEESDAAGK